MLIRPLGCYDSGMKHSQRLGLLAVSLSLLASPLAGCDSSKTGKSGSEHEKLAELTVDEVEARLAKGDAFHVFDVNPKEVFDAGRVPTAKWIEKVTADVLPADKTAALMFYCANER